jgi:hypothetical protein
VRDAVERLSIDDADDRTLPRKQRSRRRADAGCTAGH